METVRALDPDRLTPIDALVRLREIVSRFAPRNPGSL
jgi:hypothetical protein